MAEALTIGSLFSGIGGFEKGLELAGLGPVLWQVENNSYCRAVLARHWPEARRYDDARDIGRRSETLLGVAYENDGHVLEHVDVICGGFPCQDISFSGRGAGIGGHRSGLWSEYRRIICELTPRFVAIENVSALVARGLDVVLSDLAASGYDALWFNLRADELGASQRRDRLFAVAWRQVAHGDADRRKQLATAWLHADGSLGDDAARRSRRASWPPGPDDLAGWQAWTAAGGPEPGICRSSHGLPGRVERLGALGNAVVPACAEVVGHVIRMLAARTP